MHGEEERRRHVRLGMRSDARVRVRPAGSSGIGTLARVRDASAAGARLVADELIGEGWHVMEVLTAAGTRPSRALEARLIWAEQRDDGEQHLGCCFDL